MLKALDEGRGLFDGLRHGVSEPWASGFLRGMSMKEEMGGHIWTGINKKEWDTIEKDTKEILYWG